MSKTGIMVCGHGSRDTNAVREFEEMVKGLPAHFPDIPVEFGFLEFATPNIHTGLNSLLDQGVTKILAVPGMLFAAGHVKNDVPSVLNDYAAAHPEITIEFGRELGIDPKLLQAAADHIKKASEDAGDHVSPEETLLMVVGRGTSDPDANGNINKICRILWEGLGYGWGEVCYSGVTFPLVAPGLEHATKLGYKRIVVFPYFLFTGILVNRIYDITDQVAAQFPDIEFVKASYLGSHPMVVSTFADRLRGIDDGDVNMNCQMCKYREQVVGFEAHQAMPQQGHHYHVQAGGAAEHDHDHDHAHEHSHDHDHDHGHHHPPHPHADHPHGPGKRNSEAAE
ncbi:MAG: sirohydrochlorin chelatase [Proteobacteria bacterium]|nr:sirohydrochlorin chelatase [Pseudomonadota bacterium]